MWLVRHFEHKTVSIGVFGVDIYTFQVGSCPSSQQYENLLSPGAELERGMHPGGVHGACIQGDPWGVYPGGVHGECIQ